MAFLGRLCARMAALCERHPRFVILSFTLSILCLSILAIPSLRIDTNTRNLFSNAEPWRQNEQAFFSHFPHLQNALILVVDAPIPETADRATRLIIDYLSAQTDAIQSVHSLTSNDFLRNNGLLFLSPDTLISILENLIQAQPFLHILIADPSLRGLFQALSLTLENYPQIPDPSSLDSFFSTLNHSLEQTSLGHYAPVSWASLLSGHSLLPSRHLLIVTPILDFNQINHAKNAINVVRQTSALFDPQENVHIRLTGDSVFESEEFATVIETAWISVSLSIALVMIVLFWALRSLRMILAIIFTLILGLMATTSFAAIFFQTLNPISIVFAGLFIGIGVDFGIQFCIRYRTLLPYHPTPSDLLSATAQSIGRSLLIASITLGVSFSAFAPTPYVGIAQLGLISTIGLFIAAILNLTLLPACLTLLAPSRDHPPLLYLRTQTSYQRLMRHRNLLTAIITLSSIAVIALSTFIELDSNMLNLRDNRLESVKIARELSQNSNTTPFQINILAPSRSQANALEQRLSSLPEVSLVQSIEQFIPPDQAEKLAIIQDARFILEPSLFPPAVSPPPTDTEILASLSRFYDLIQPLTSNPVLASFAQRLSEILLLDPELSFALLQTSLLTTLTPTLDLLKHSLSPVPITLDSLPNPIKRDWIAPSTVYRLSVSPQGDPDDPQTLQSFVHAVRGLAPQATGTAVVIQEAMRTVIRSFLIAFALAIAVSMIVLFLILNRWKDILIVLIPLVIAGFATLALCVLTNTSLNFANIITFPISFGLGLIFNIYFVLHWRVERSPLLQASIVHAILISALTTAAAFFSFTLSTHPGVSSMGVLLILSLFCILVTTFFVLPILLSFRLNQ